MIPASTSTSRLTRRGRLAGRWAAALADPDPYRRIRALLDLTTDFAKRPKAVATLWPHYLNSVLRGPHAALLTQTELAALEDVGTIVSSRSQGRLTLADAWYPLLVARDARGEHYVVTAMLSRLYWSPDLEPPGKDDVARNLAMRGASGDEHLAVYVDYLRRGAAPHYEPAITALLGSCLTVGFDASPDWLHRAGNLAQQLHVNGIAVPGVDLALGYAYLLAARDPHRAVPHLTAAHNADRDDQTALLGLLSALVRTGEHECVATLADKAGSSAVVTGLVELSATLRWLDDPALPGHAPSTANRLATLPVATQAGEWLDYATGRLHLLEGATQQAATVLVATADRCPEQPHWHYHAACALHLLGEWRGVARRFMLADGWPARWTIGLLLVDANPALAPEIAGELADSGLTPSHARIVDARMAMLPPSPAPVAPMELPEDPVGSVEPLVVRLETLRTNLGLHFAQRDTAAMATAMSHPLFQRLPLADQLLWSGLAHLPNDHGRSLLIQAAEELAHPRAGLVLTAHELSCDQVPDPAWLAGLSWRQDTTIELVRAWSALASGDVDAAMARLAGPSTEDEPRANYTLANAWLLKAPVNPDAFSRAATAFAAAVEHDWTVPDGAQLLMRCAVLAADLDARTASLDDHRAEIGGMEVTPWVAWTVALTALHSEPADVPLETYEQLVTLIEKADAPVAAATPAVTAGLTRACMAAARAEHADALRALFDRVALTTSDDEINRLRELITANALRNGVSIPTSHTGGVPTALVLAERSLTDQRRTAAAACLRDAANEHGTGSRFCQIAADFLEDRPITLDRPPEGDSPDEKATQLLVAVASAANDLDEGLDHILTMLRTRDLSGIVDLRGALPALCGRTSRGRQVPPHLEALVREIATTTDGVFPAAVLADCASAVGARDIALALWRRVVTEDAAAWTRYAAALRHEAAVARRGGEERRAIDCLLLAAHASVVRDPEQLPPEEDAQLPTPWLLDQTEVIAHADAADATFAVHAVRELCVARLLTHIFGPGYPNRGRPGRLHVLEEAVAGSRTLCMGLLDNDTKTIRPAWRSMAAAHAANIRFHHTLAVLYREHALDVDVPAGRAAHHLTVATALWSLLLSTKRFWRHVGERVTAEEARLREKVCRELFAVHTARGRRALAAGNAAAAAAHLRCLVNHERDASKVITTLDETGIRFRHKIDADRFAVVSALASEALSEWVDDVLNVATAALTDPDAIALLPEGVSQNYAGGIEQLQPFLQLGGPVPSVLRTGLEWYNEWTYAEYHRERHERVAELTAAASILADVLIPTCVKGQGLRPENQALSKHMLFRGFTADDHATAIRHYKTALDWNPGNANAQQLLDQRTEVEADEQLARAARDLEKGRLDAALKQLKSIDATTSAQRLVRDRLINAAKFRVAVGRKNWTTAERILRKELANAAPAERKAVAQQIASVLNAHAVDLTKKATHQARALGDALTAIFAEARRQLENPLTLSRSDRFGDFDDGELSELLSRLGNRSQFSDLLTRFAGRAALPGCAVCGTEHATGRKYVVNALVREARTHRVVRATDVVSFWTRFEQQLCSGCRSKLQSITEARRSAVALLTEARQLDSRNPVIRKNITELGTDL